MAIAIRQQISLKVHSRLRGAYKTNVDGVGNNSMLNGIAK